MNFQSLIQSVWGFKLGMALYPPLLFNAIRPIYVSKDFRYIRVKIRQSLLNRNINGAIFGGTISAAFDPWIGVMIWQILYKKKIAAEVWVKSLEVQYKKPGRTSLFIDFKLNEEDIQKLIGDLQKEKKYTHQFTTQAIDTHGNICAIGNIEVVVKCK